MALLSLGGTRRSTHDHADCQQHFGWSGERAVGAAPTLLATLIGRGIPGIVQEPRVPNHRRRRSHSPG